MSKVKGMKRYERDILSICNFQNIDSLGTEDKDGAYGVAMVMAYMWDGVSANVVDFANALELSPVQLEAAFDRLKINGIFSSKYNARQDAVLNGYRRNEPVNQWISSQHLTENAWCQIHGVASGRIGIR